MKTQHNKRTNECNRTGLFKLFKNLDYEIDVDINKNIIKYLGGEMKLLIVNVSPYIKPNANLRYVNIKSNPLPI